MKAALFLLIVSIAASPCIASAQDAPTARPTQGPMTVERIYNPFVITPEYKITDIDGETGQILGLSIGRLLDSRLFVGGGGYWLVDGPRGTDMWYGGAIVGWRQWAERSIAVTLQGLAGFGEAEQETDLPFFATGPHRDNRRFDTRGGRVELRQDFLMFEPQADVTVKVMKGVSLRAGVGYRLTTAESTVAGSIDGVTGTFGAQIAW